MPVYIYMIISELTASKAIEVHVFDTVVFVFVTGILNLSNLQSSQEMYNKVDTNEQSDYLMVWNVISSILQTNYSGIVQNSTGKISYSEQIENNVFLQ